MNLKQLLDKIFIDGPLAMGGILDYHISSEYLELIKDEILDCDEFKDVNSLTIIHEPTFIEDGKTITTHTAKLRDGYVFSGDVKILSLAFTPPIYNPTTINDSIKDGCVITPLMFNTETFTPYRKLIMYLDIEKMRDESLMENKNYKVEIHELLDKILDNPKDYYSKGERGVLLRGYW
jgi:hypothetical protein